MPVPGMLNDGFNGWVLWFPLKLVLDLLATSYKGSRISRPSGLFNDLELLAGDLFTSIDNLSYRVATLASKIINIAFTFLEGLQR